ncbi:MAG: hypothetical protein N3B01_10135 [Verrucomicrobiae bacterium]|nr:hypothetical protein [Verrucomicrobiae bacterium]
MNMVHGVVRHYDLPDLAELVGRNKLNVTEPVDPMGRPITTPLP